MDPSPRDRMRNPYRWVVLSAFALVAGVTQMLWLNFAPLLTLVEKRYGVSELVASTLILVFPLIYVLLSLPAGALIDARGYRFAVGLGAVVTAAFAALRIWDESFWVLLAAQVGIAVAQPFIINGVSKLVADWFEETEGATANGIGTLGMFLGMAVAMAATPALEQAAGLRVTMIVFFVVAAAAAAAFVVLVRPNLPAPEPLGSASESAGFGALLRDRQLLLCFGAAFLGLGAFNALTTWIEQILAPHGVDATTAGLVGGVLIVGGIVGAVVIPLLSDRVRRRKPFLIACCLIAAVCTWLLCRATAVPTLMTFAALLGFFFMPSFALLLDVSAQLAGVRHAGAATSLLMLAGNAGGVALILLVPELKGAAGDYVGAALLMAGALVVAAVLMVALREPGSEKVPAVVVAGG
jgi:predicted MFS family arabinose efflux permease